MSKTKRRSTRVDFCIAEGRIEDAAILLLGGLWLLLREIPPDEQDAFIDEFEAGPNALDRVVTAVEDWLDAQK